MKIKMVVVEKTMKKMKMDKQKILWTSSQTEATFPTRNDCLFKEFKCFTSTEHTHTHTVVVQTQCSLKHWDRWRGKLV